MSDEVELRIAWASIAPPTPRSAEVFDDLVGRHRQPHRRYHGLRHVVWVLRHSRRLEAAIAECQQGVPGYDAAVVTAAACFHDAVYDPRADDNEERSARLAETQLASLDWPTERCAFVAELVRATAGHLADGDGAGEAAPWERQVLLDADLAVLGAEPAALRRLRQRRAQRVRPPVGRRVGGRTVARRRVAAGADVALRHRSRRVRGGTSGRGPTSRPSSPGCALSARR